MIDGKLFRCSAKFTNISLVRSCVTKFPPASVYCKLQESTVITSTTSVLSWHYRFFSPYIAIGFLLYTVSYLNHIVQVGSPMHLFDSPFLIFQYYLMFTPIPIPTYYIPITYKSVPITVSITYKSVPITVSITYKSVPMTHIVCSYKCLNMFL